MKITSNTKFTNVIFLLSQIRERVQMAYYFSSEMVKKLQIRLKNKNKRIYSFHVYVEWKLKT